MVKVITSVNLVFFAINGFLDGSGYECELSKSI